MPDNDSTRHRSGIREGTPEPVPEEHGPPEVAKMTPKWVADWERYWRDLNSEVSRGDVCQLCCKVGHTAVRCQFYVPYVKDGVKWRKAQREQAGALDQEAEDGYAKLYDQLRAMSVCIFSGPVGVILLVVCVAAAAFFFTEDETVANSIIVAGLLGGGIVLLQQGFKRD